MKGVVAWVSVGVVVSAGSPAARFWDTLLLPCVLGRLCGVAHGRCARAGCVLVLVGWSAGALVLVSGQVVRAVGVRVRWGWAVAGCAGVYGAPLSILVSGVGGLGCAVVVEEGLRDG